MASRSEKKTTKTPPADARLFCGALENDQHRLEKAMRQLEHIGALGRVLSRHRFDFERYPAGR